MALTGHFTILATNNHARKNKDFGSNYWQRWGRIKRIIHLYDGDIPPI